MSDVLNHHIREEVPLIEVIDDDKTREAVHADFEAIVVNELDTLPDTLKEELRTTSSQKNKGDTDRSDRYMW